MDPSLRIASSVLRKIFLVVFFADMAMAVAGQRVPALQALDQMRAMKGNSAGEVKKVMVDAVPGVSYPTLSEIPRTTFSCEQVGQPGYYADMDAYCQVYRRCELDGGMSSFICPNKTLFNQITLVCDWWFNVNCAKAVAFYTYSNPRLFYFNGKFLEDAVTHLPPTNFNSRLNNFPAFLNSRPLTNFQLEDSLGHRDDQEEASEMQFEFNDATPATPSPVETRKLTTSNVPMTPAVRPQRKEMEQPLPQENSRAAPGGSLFFASERFAMPMFEAPPVREGSPQDDRLQLSDNSQAVVRQPSDNPSPGWSLPSSGMAFEQETTREATRTSPVPKPFFTASAETEPANRNEQSQPKPIRNSFRILRPTHTTAINPSFFPK